MKKFFAIALILCLLCSMTALAARPDNNKPETTDNSNRETKLQVTINSGYTIVIPSKLDITYGAESTNLAVEVQELHLTSKYNALKVSVGNMERLKNKDNNAATIEYTIDGKTFGAVRYFKTTETQNFVVGIAAANWKKAPAGTYSGTVSFNVEFGNQTSN